MKLIVVVLCYRVPDLTIDCLRSLSREIGRVPGAKVGLCENGTGGDTAERLSRAIEENGWGSWVDLTVVYPNLGFTGGNNLVISAGARVGRSSRVCAALERRYDRPGTCAGYPGGVHGSSSQGRDRRQPAPLARWRAPGTPFRFQGILSELDRGLQLGIVSRLVSPWTTVPTPTVACPAEWVSGASIILRRSMLDQIGLLDEGLYTYFDDIDICLRARRAGWETWYVPESKIIHLEGSSTGVTPQARKRRPAYWFQARRRYFLKSYGGLYTALVDAAFLFGFAIWRVRRRIQRKPERTRPTCWATRSATASSGRGSS